MDRVRSRKLWLLMFLVIYFSNGAFARLYIPALVGILLLAIVTIIVTNNREIITIDRSLFPLLALVGALRVITCIANGYSLVFDTIAFLAILFAVLFVSEIEFDTFIKYFTKVIVFITLISSILYILQLVMPVFSLIPSVLYKNLQSGSDTKVILYSFVLQTKSLYTYYRNVGIFSEPGQFQIFINIALIAELFYLKEINLRCIVILVIGIFTCNSANGFLVTACVLAAFFLDGYMKKESKKHSIRQILFIGIIIALIIGMYYFRESLYNLLNQNLEKFINMQSSYSYSDRGTGLERKRAFDTAVKEFISSPIWGLGYVGTQAYQTSLSSTGFIMTFTPLNWFAQNGFLLGLIMNTLYLAPWFKMPKKLPSKVLIIIAIFLMISAQAVTNDILTWIIVFYGFRFVIRRKTKKIEG